MTSMWLSRSGGQDSFDNRSGHSTSNIYPGTRHKLNFVSRNIPAPVHTCTVLCSLLASKCSSTTSQFIYLTSTFSLWRMGDQYVFKRVFGLLVSINIMLGVCFNYKLRPNYYYLKVKIVCNFYKHEKSITLSMYSFNKI